MNAKIHTGQLFLFALILISAVCLSISMAQTVDPLEQFRQKEKEDEQARLEAEKAMDRLLVKERWQEESFGLSFRPPKDAKLINSPRDNAIVRMEIKVQELAASQAETGMAQLRIVQSEDELDIYKMGDISIQELGILQPSTITLDTKRMKMGKNLERPGLIIYYRIRNKTKPDVLLAHAFMTLDPHTYAMMELEMTYEVGHHEKVVERFETMFQSLQIASPKELEEQRKNLLERGEVWKQSTTIRRLREVMPDKEQFYRLTEDGKDVGYVRLWFDTNAKERKWTGVRIIRQMRFFDAKRERVIDYQLNAFLSSDRKHEVWQILSTLRPYSPDGKKVPGEVTGYSELGLSSPTSVSVVRHAAGENDDLQRSIRVLRDGKGAKLESIKMTGKPLAVNWTKPDLGYLSIIERDLLPYLIPHERGFKYAFYSYLPGEQKIAFRTARVENLDSGGYLVYSRLAPDLPEEQTHISRDGIMVQHTFSDGVVMTPASREQLVEIWEKELGESP